MTSIPPVVVRYLVDGVENVVAGNARVQRAVSGSAKLAQNMGAAMATANVGTQKWAAGMAELGRQGLGARKSLDLTSTAASATTKALAGLGAAYVATKVARFVLDTVQATARLHDLSQQTGATVEMLSVLKFAGAQAGVSVEELAVGFKGLAISLGQLKDGNKQAVEAFREIGLTAKDLEGLSVDQVFRRITEALAQLPPGFDKAEVASRIFGRSGAALIPLLDDLAKQGFDKATAAAEKFNAVVSSEEAAQADAFTDSLTAMGAAAGGLARGFAGDLIPALTDLLTLLAKATTALNQIKVLSDQGLGALLNNPFLFGIGRGLQGPDLPSFSGIQSGGSTTATRPGEKPLSLEDEIKALAAIREAGRLTEAQQQRINEIVRQLNEEYAKSGTTLERQAEIAGDIERLTRTRKEAAREVTDEERRQAEIMQEQARQAGDLLRLEQERRQAVLDRIAAEKTAEFNRLAESTGGAGSFEALIARQQRQFADNLNVGVPTLSEEAQRLLDAQRAKSLEYVNTLLAESDAAALAYQNIGEAIRNSLAGDLADFFSRGIVEAESFGDALRELGLTIVSTIQQIVAQLLAAQIVQGIAGVLFGSIPGAPAGGNLDGQSLSGLAGSAPTFAEGGYVSGPGTSTSDSIPARLSDGEFVVNARATAANYDLLQAVNDGLRPVGPIVRAPRHYAGGGLVESGGGMSTVVLEAPDGWSGRVQNDSDTLQVIVRNRRTVRDMLK